MLGKVFQEREVSLWAACRLLPLLFGHSLGERANETSLVGTAARSRVIAYRGTITARKLHRLTTVELHVKPIFRNFRNSQIAA